MRYAIIENDIVINIVISNKQLEANWIAIPICCPVGIGDSYINGCFYDVKGNIRHTQSDALMQSHIDDLEKENSLLIAQIQALSDRNDFLEDCMAEIAGTIYA